MPAERNVNKRISFYTLGCRLNQSETAVIENSFRSRGYAVMPFSRPADIVVVNTCTVTEQGDGDTRRLVNRINRRQPLAKIALIGCQAQMQKHDLARLKNVRWVVGNERKMALADILEQDPVPQEPVIAVPAISRKPFSQTIAGVDHSHTRANLKIQDGCDFFCSFCEIPFARGRARSREFEDILKEARILVEAGHRELVLTGVNIGTYRYQDKTFLDILLALRKIDRLRRIRISSIEPTTIPPDLIRLMEQEPRICRHLHIPLQSGHDEILKAMNRKYPLKEFDRFLRQVLRRIPDACLGTDLIVGYPGETPGHFQATLNYLKDSPLHYSHVFSYSTRRQARTRRLTDQMIDPGEIRERSRALRQCSAQKRQAFYASFLQTRQTVLFEQRKEGLWSGLTSQYIRVFVKSGQDLANQMRRVTVTHVTPRGVLGTLE